MSKYKTAKTIKEFKTTCKGQDVVVPVGSKVSNKTACGYDDGYRFWEDFRNTVDSKRYGLLHDLTHYGVNVPAECCESYEENE